MQAGVRAPGHEVIEPENNVETAKLADAATNQIVNGVCRTMSAIPDYFGRTRLALSYMEGFPGAVIPEQMLCQRILAATAGGAPCHV